MCAFLAFHVHHERYTLSCSYNAFEILFYISKIGFYVVLSNVCISFSDRHVLDKTTFYYIQLDPQCVTLAPIIIQCPLAIINSWSNTHHPPKRHALSMTRLQAWQIWSLQKVPPTLQYHQSHQLPICKKWRLLQPQTENWTTLQIYHSWHLPSSPHVGKHQCTWHHRPPKEVFLGHTSWHNPRKTHSIWTEGLYMSQKAPIDKST